MARPRYYPHPDKNQPEIVQQLKALGFWVVNVSRWLTTPDLFVCGYDANRSEHRWTAWEVKVEGGKLTAEQEQTLAEHEGDLLVARSVDDILTEYAQGGLGEHNDQ